MNFNLDGPNRDLYPWAIVDDEGKFRVWWFHCSTCNSTYWWDDSSIHNLLVSGRRLVKCGLGHWINVIN